MKITIGNIIKELFNTTKAKISVSRKEIKINGEKIDIKIDDKDEVKILIEGGVADIDASVVMVNGDVNGNIDASSVECKDVNGNIDASSIICGKVKGNIDAISIIGNQ